MDLQDFTLVKFKEGEKRRVNPYEIKKQIQDKTGSDPEALTTDGRRAFTIKVKNEELGRKLLKVKEIMGVECTVEKHNYFNRSKGIIYIHEFDIDDLDDFKAGIMENYNVSQVKPIAFIMPKYAQTRVFLITFDSETCPDAIYIPWERSDTRVYSFYEKPKLFKNCYQYGHIKSRCNHEKRCNRCSRQHDDIEKCTSNEYCLHCQVGHKIGSKECPVQKKEQSIIDTQQQHKVGRRRAVQILEGYQQPASNHSKPKFATHFKCSIGEENKRKLTPWLLQKSVQHAIGEKPKSIRSSGKGAFIIEVSTVQQSRDILKLAQINNMPVEIREDHNIKNKALIYIHQYDLRDFEQFREGLKDDFNLYDVQMANWIKPRTPYSKT